jgi:hypothetical protein
VTTLNCPIICIGKQGKTLFLKLHFSCHPYKLEVPLPHSSSFLLFLLIFELNNKIPEHKNNTQIIIFS